MKIFKVVQSLIKKKYTANGAPSYGLTSVIVHTKDIKEAEKKGLKSKAYRITAIWERVK